MLACSIRGLVHFRHGGKHGSMETAMVLEKQLKVLYLYPQTTRREKQWAWHSLNDPHRIRSSGSLTSAKAQSKREVLSCWGVSASIQHPTLSILMVSIPDSQQKGESLGSPTLRKGKQTPPSHLQWHTSSNKTMPPTPFKLWHFLVTKHSSLWAYGNRSHSNHYSNRWVCEPYFTIA